MDIPNLHEFARVLLRAIFDHYFDLRGRVSRSEFGYFIAGVVVIFICAAIADLLADGPLPGIIVELALLPPIAGMGARRLQDSGRPGTLVLLLVGPLATMCAFSLLFLVEPFNELSLFWYASGLRGLVELTALVALIAMIYLWLQPGTEGDNPFGTASSTN